VISFFFLIYWVQHPREIKQKVSRKSADGAFEKFQVPNFGFIGVNQSVAEASNILYFYDVYIIINIILNIIILFDLSCQRRDLNTPVCGLDSAGDLEGNNSMKEKYTTKYYVVFYQFAILTRKLIKNVLKKFEVYITS
jgi:hypothetical protein